MYFSPATLFFKFVYQLFTTMKKITDNKEQIIAAQAAIED